jgi:hypothetical protein
MVRILFPPPVSLQTSRFQKHILRAEHRVFTNGYRHNQRSVPAPLNTIKVGDRLAHGLRRGPEPGQAGWLGARDQQGRQRRRQHGSQAGFLLALAELTHMA